MFLLTTDGVLCPFYMVYKNPKLAAGICHLPKPLPTDGERLATSSGIYCPLLISDVFCGLHVGGGGGVFFPKSLEGRLNGEGGLYLIPYFSLCVRLLIFPTLNGDRISKF